MFGNASNMLAPGTAHHLCQAIRRLYLVRLAIRRTGNGTQRLAGEQLEDVDSFLVTADRQATHDTFFAIRISGPNRVTAAASPHEHASSQKGTAKQSKPKHPGDRNRRGSSS